MLPLQRRIALGLLPSLFGRLRLLLGLGKGRFLLGLLLRRLLLGLLRSFLIGPLSRSRGSGLLLCPGGIGKLLLPCFFLALLCCFTFGLLPRQLSGLGLLLSFGKSSFLDRLLTRGLVCLSFRVSLPLRLCSGIACCLRLCRLLLSGSFDRVNVGLSNVGENRCREFFDELPKIALVAGILDLVPTSLFLR